MSYIAKHFIKGPNIALRYLSERFAAKLARYAMLTVLLLTLAILLRRNVSMSSDIGNKLLSSSTLGPSISIFSHKPRQRIHNATLGQFQQILAINLPERTDHRDGLVLAAAVSNISIRFIEGVRGDSVSLKALPSSYDHDLSRGEIGSWRAHMKALSRVVEEGWSTVLILEDDVDWDIRLKCLLHNFAVSSSYLLQHSENPIKRIWLQDIKHLDLSTRSPYGDNWDVIWLGHCGMEIPSNSSMVIHENDQSVPEVGHLKSWDTTSTSPLRYYPPHTRLVTHQQGGVCSLAYAVSQAGAQKLLYRIGLQRLESAFDIMLRQFCEGANGEEPHICLSVLPQLFDHHRRVGLTDTDSDISSGNGGFRHEAFTNNIRYSIRLNMAQLLRGAIDYVDQWPDSRTA